VSVRAAARTGGEVLADALLLHGVDMAFAVCGESFLPLLDALFDRPQLRLISCRHEAGAAMMAEATAKLTGRPGVCLVSRGPGACHATIGLHTAFQDATPMVLLIGVSTGTYSSVFIASMFLVTWQQGDLGRMWRRITGRGAAPRSPEAVAAE
jgi:thiamine pyrophosphate-dependent acetolactate synthase large subunit-like protein